MTTVVLWPLQEVLGASAPEHQLSPTPVWVSREAERRENKHSAPEECQSLSHTEEPDLNPPWIIYWLWNFRQMTQIF